MSIAPKKMRGQGVERVMKKLQVNIELGQYYEAHQMYRTLYFRYLSQQKYDELMSLLYEGAILFLSHNQHMLWLLYKIGNEVSWTRPAANYGGPRNFIANLCLDNGKVPNIVIWHNSGSDLAVLLVNVLNESQAAVTDEHMEKLGNLFAMMLPDSPERANFLASALKWSGKAADNSTPGSFGHPRLHQSVALTLWKEKNYQQSRYHFIHSTDGDGCATMLIEYHITKGYPSEVDLFIAQTVLQYLCLQNKSTASTAFHAYTEKHPAVSSGFPFLLPLLNFLEFLLQAIEREKLAYFRTLCEQYQPSLKRDPCYSDYVDRIGQIFFGLTPPPKQQGIFGNFIQSLLEGFDENFSEEPAEPVPGSSKNDSYKISQDELD